MKFNVKILTPERELYSGEADMVVIPSAQGDIGVLARHAPLIAKLRVGIIKIKSGDGERLVATTGGIAEVSDNNMSLLLDVAEFKEEIDADRAKAAKERAEKRLKSNNQDVDFSRAQAALDRAIIRMKIVK